MTTERRLCVICAWREHCQKRFSVSSDGLLNIHCPDYTRDFTIKDLEADKKVVDAVLEKWRRQGVAIRRPCITVSREPGAGGSEIARKMAADLKMDLMGGQIISRVAESTRMSEKVVATLDEKNVTTLDTWLTSLFTARHLWPDVYLKHLTKVIGTIGQHGNAVIVGRGAHFILSPDWTFRLRLVGPLEGRIQKNMKDRGCSHEEAESYIIKTEADRSAFMKKYFHEDINNPAHFDMILNTGGMTVAQAAEIVKAAFLARKWPEASPV